MAKIYGVILIVFCTILFPSQICSAKTITNFNDLIENGKSLDNSTVTVRGEAIGERMNRGDYSWVNISDGSSGMGIWMKNEDADKIKVYGNYRNKGDIVEVQGIFNRACSEHGGDMDIHAQSVNIITKGYSVKEKIQGYKIIAALGLTLLTLILGIIGIVKRTKLPRL